MVTNWCSESFQAEEDSYLHKDGHTGFYDRVQLFLNQGGQAMEGRRANIPQPVFSSDQVQDQEALHTAVWHTWWYSKEHYVAFAGHTKGMLQEFVQVKQESVDHLSSALNLQREDILRDLHVIPQFNP